MLLGVVGFALTSEAQAQTGRNRAQAHRGNTNQHRSKRYVPNVYHPNSGGPYVGFGTPVVGGWYMPGYGVNGGGFPGSYPVVGGLYAPGYGVMGTPPTPVVGGLYSPGYGVMGAGGAQHVQGGTYTPGYGVR